MTKLTNWIKQHQVATFFILAFGITWPLFLLIFFVFPGNQLIQVLTGGPLAVFSPALAAMLISAIIEPQRKQESGKRRWIAFGVSWAIFSLLPAWVLSSAFARTTGIRKQFSTLLRPRGSFIWYLVSLFAALDVFAIVSDRMWKRLPPDQPAVCPPMQFSQTVGEPTLAKP